MIIECSDEEYRTIKRALNEEANNEMYLLMVGVQGEELRPDSIWNSEIAAEKYAESNLDQSTYDYDIVSLPYEPGLGITNEEIE